MTPLHMECIVIPQFTLIVVIRILTLSLFPKNKSINEIDVVVILLSTEFDSISELKKLLDANCKIEKVQPPIIASDTEVNIVIVTAVCPDGKIQTIKAYREEAAALREFIRTHR